MAWPFDRPPQDPLHLLAEVALEALAAAAGEEEPPVFIPSDEEDEDEGELEVGPLQYFNRWLAPPDEEDDDEEEEEDDEEEDEDSDWDEVDSGYGSLSEEEEEEDDEEEGEEDDQVFSLVDFLHGWRHGALPAQAGDLVGRSPTPDPEPSAESPSPTLSMINQLLCAQKSPLFHRRPAVPPPPAPSAPGPGPAPASPALGGSKRTRDEDEEEDPSSKRPRFSYFEDSPDEPSPSTSAGMSAFSRYFHFRPDLLRDPDDSDDND